MVTISYLVLRWGKSKHEVTVNRTQVTARDMKIEEKSLLVYNKTAVSLLWKTADAYFHETDGKKAERLNMIQQLLQFPCDLNQQQLVFWNNTFITISLLHWAALEQDDALSALLIAAQADPDQKDAKGYTSFDYVDEQSGDFPTKFYELVSKAQPQKKNRCCKARDCTTSSCW